VIRDRSDHRGLSRRAFVACCGLHATAGLLSQSAVRTAAAQDDDLAWICAAPQFPTNAWTEILRRFDFKLMPTPYMLAAAPGAEASFGPMTPLLYQTFQLALRSDAWLSGDGLPGSTPARIRIGVDFLDGTDTQKQHVVATVPAWLGQGGAPIEFVFDNRDKNHIRISFSGRNYSEIGRRASAISDKSVPTMNLAGVRAANPIEKNAPLILHEFGHALGLRHEHLHPEGGIAWNETEVIKDLSLQGRSEAEIRRDVLDGLDQSYRCVGAPEFDRTSIMIYPIPPKWTTNGFSVAAPLQLSPSDLRCAARLYA